MRIPFAVLLLSSASAAAAEPRVQFGREVRPILSEACYQCHGPDPQKRKGGLRLDTFQGATARGDDGAAVVPGKPDQSNLLRRILTRDEDDRMPPPDSHKRVTPEQTEILRRWIAQGASYEAHWAFVPPRRPAVPAASDVRHPIDAFVRTRLAAEGLTAAPAARPEVWLRRATLDLTGLPPTLPELDAFLADVATRGEAAYAAAVDRLLASPRYGERMAQDWMDVARYADTHGFNNDSARSMWRWRDWVIAAFNDNVPYDRFIREQLAGDLLPNPTLEQRVATGFGRNHVINSEGGIIEEEYRVEYVADRVRTVGMAWLGLTLECARCHDHKFDPLTQKDYYRLFAFFDNVPEHGEDGRVANAPPMIAAPTREQAQRLAVLGATIAEVEGALPRPPGDLAAWRARLRAALPAAVAAPGGTAIDGALLAVGKTIPREQLAVDVNKPFTVAVAVRWDGGVAPLLSNMRYEVAQSAADHGRGAELRVDAEGRVEVRLSERWPAYAIQAVSRQRLERGGWHHLAVSYDGSKRGRGITVYVDGEPTPIELRYDGLPGDGGRDPLKVGETRGTPLRLRGALADLRVWSQALGPERLVPFARDAVARRLAGEGSATVERVRAAALLLTDDGFRRNVDRRAALRHEEARVLREVPTTMVMAELPSPRATHLLQRGRYDLPGEKVTPGVPALLGPWPAGAPLNRLGLAAWLTNPAHPLTARVVVNRLWQQLFGAGLVKSVEDLGYQSDWPTHPEVLDWLARELVDGGWDVKALLRGLVLSSTYRQDSTPHAWAEAGFARRSPSRGGMGTLPGSPSQSSWAEAGFARRSPSRGGMGTLPGSPSQSMAERDPENRLLARGPRARLPAEMIRDHGLAVSGLLRERVGGPSVFPYQPADFFKGIIVDAKYPGTSWTQSAGDDLYRRSLYTFWKRTVLHPVMATFDAPDRETCTARRARTNTPLQALTLMNETGAVEAARHLAQRMLAEAEGDDARLTLGFRAATSRAPTADELRVLRRTLVDFRRAYRADRKGALALVGVGSSPRPRAVDARELAAATAVASVILNLDESVTKR